MDLQIFFGLLLFFSPGYLILFIMFPKRNELNSVETLVLGAVLCFTEVIILGAVLVISPLGFTLESVTNAQISILFILLVVAFLKGKKRSARKRFDLKFLDKLDTMSNSELGLLLVLVFSMVFMGVVTGAAIIGPKPTEEFTEFYMVGPDGEFNSLPSSLDLNEQNTIVLVVANNEGQDTKYRLEMQTGADKKILAEVQVLKGQTWVFPITIGMDSSQIMVFLLYKDGMDEPYRMLQLRNPN